MNLKRLLRDYKNLIKLKLNKLVVKKIIAESAEITLHELKLAYRDCRES